ncbi:hypothetical protein Tsubulata_007661 [Turnera subulata]|uniref:SGNH hydrolase-type esterase domain-containing protein n=1 Tax=Turnera subulata TaxID=218843 RepID=A0A9Q0JB22_9ROSI|nr:hypothetical protein Tsubulata_007661 [Turnera subulata]
MARHGCLLTFLLLSLAMAIYAGAEDIKSSGVKLFVFGDSFADTGNWDANKAPLLYPFGMTWPGKPAGRQGDGYILTDIIALFFNTTAPPAYFKWKKNAASEPVSLGMNFAYSGSGAMPDAWEIYSLGVQLGQFKEAVESKAFTENDIKDAVALVSSVGNDFRSFLKKLNRSESELPERAKMVRAEMFKFFEGLEKMGIKKAIMLSVSNFRDGKVDPVLVEHNKLLMEGLQAFAKRSNMKIVFLDIDKLEPVARAMYPKDKWEANCCEPEKKYDFSQMCGEKDASGRKLYSLCSDPSQIFYFFRFHISHEGWKKIYSLILESKVLEPLR